MNDHRTVLVPLDGSSAADRAAELASLLTGPGDRIVLFAAIPQVLPPLEIGSRVVIHNRTLPSEIERVQTEVVQPVAEHLGAAGRKVETVVEPGDPADAILAAADTYDADLIVMSTSGHGAAGRAIFGSVADRVARHGTRPTLLMRSGARPTRPTRVLVPLDGSRRAEAALPVAAQLARHLDLPVHLLRVIDLQDALDGVHNLPGEQVTDRPFKEGQALAHQDSEDYLLRQAEAVRQLGGRATHEVMEGPALFTILEATTPDDLVVMTSHGRGGIRRWLLGSLADKLVRQAQAPVVLVPARGESPG